MKKVFLLMKYYLDKKENLPFPKFDYQIDALKTMGFSVYFLGIRHGKIYLCHDGIEKEVYKLHSFKLPGFSTLSIYDGLYKAARKVFQEESFDMAYIRAMPTMPSYSRAFKSIKDSNCKIVVEIPTFPIEKEIDTEERLLRKLYFQLSNIYFMKKSHYVDLFAVIGENASELSGRPAINIENGISLESIPLRNPSPISGEIHILGLANMARWHGYDRIIEGLREYKEKGGTDKVVLHLVGPDGDGSLAKWKALTIQYGLEENVVFEGPKYGENLRWYFDSCHLAVGSIGMHRKKFDSTSELKVREYVARGIPFILATRDKAISPNLKFYLEVNNDNPVDIDAIIQFAKKTTKNTELPLEMREYAKNHMTWGSQFDKIINLF